MSPSSLCVFAVLFVSSAQALQLPSAESQSSTRRPRVTKYSKTTAVPGGSTESVTDRNFTTPTYRLLATNGETCILLTVDALIAISYVTKLNERTEATTFIPNNAKVDGNCRDGDAETLSLSFKEFTLEWSFAKTDNGESWYVEYIRLMYNSSARLLKYSAIQKRKITLHTSSRAFLFSTPVEKSYSWPEEIVLELVDGEVSTPQSHRGKLFLREMLLQAFMFKYERECALSLNCLDTVKTRSKKAPFIVGAVLVSVTACMLVVYRVWHYMKVKNKIRTTPWNK